MPEGSEVSLAPLPEGFGRASEVTPPGGAPAPAKKVKPVDDQDEDEEDLLDLAELGDLCGDIYADVFGVAAQLYVGEALELDEKRAGRRGKQLGTVLRKLGWADEEIICYTGLVAGVASDFSLLHRIKLEKDQTARLEADTAGVSP